MESITSINQHPSKVKALIQEIDHEISSLNDYLNHLNVMISELKQERQILENFIQNPAFKKDERINLTLHEKASGEYFYG